MIDSAYNLLMLSFQDQKTVWLLISRKNGLVALYENSNINRNESVKIEMGQPFEMGLKGLKQEQGARICDMWKLCGVSHGRNFNHFKDWIV